MHGTSWVRLDKSLRYNATTAFGRRLATDVNNTVANTAFHDLTPNGITAPPVLSRLLGKGLKFIPLTHLSRLNLEDLTAAAARLRRSHDLKMLFGTSEEPHHHAHTGMVPFHQKHVYQRSDWDPPRVTIKALRQLITRATDPHRLAAALEPHKQTNKYNLTCAEYQALRDPSLHAYKVLETDKNLGPALMTTIQYTDWVAEHLRTSTAYRRVSDPFPAAKLRDRVHDLHTIMTHPNSIYHRLIKFSRADWDADAEVITRDIDELGPYYAYGMPKVHKPTLGMRLIISNTKGLLAGLSTWLTLHLQPVAAAQPTYTRDSHVIIDGTRSLGFNPATDVMLTFDVVGMHPAITFENAKEPIAHMSRDHPIKSLLMKGLALVMEHCYFTFDGKLHQQTEGTTTGTSVAPPYANLYMAYYELHHVFTGAGLTASSPGRLVHHSNKAVRYYKRLIDDGFVVLTRTASNPRPEKLMLHRLSMIPGLEFTHAVSNESAIFLDLQLYHEHGSLLTRTYQKPMNKYLYPHAASAHPVGMLSGIITGLVRNYHAQCSKFHDFERMCQLLAQRLVDRGHPAALVNTLTDTVANGCLRGTAARPVNKAYPIHVILPYDPRGPTREQLRETFELQALTTLNEEVCDDQIQLVMCHRHPPTLRGLLQQARASHTTNRPANNT